MAKPVMKPLTDTQRNKIYEWIAAGKSNKWIMSRSFMQNRSPVVLSGFRAAYTRSGDKVAPKKKAAARPTTTRNQGLTKQQQRQIEKLSADFAKSVAEIIT